MVSMANEAGPIWALLVACLNRLHDELLTEGCDRPELGVGPTVAAAALREVLERVDAAALVGPAVGAGQSGVREALQLARDCVRDLLHPDLGLDCAQLLTLASAAHVLARVEEALVPVAS